MMNDRLWTDFLSSASSPSSSGPRDAICRVLGSPTRLTLPPPCNNPEAVLNLISNGNGTSTQRPQQYPPLPTITLPHNPLIPSFLRLPQAPCPPKLPSISCSSVPRDARFSSPHQPVTLSLESQSACHILSAPLGPNFSSDSITIALKRNYVLVIIADCWSPETECEPIFPPPSSLYTFSLSRTHVTPRVHSLVVTPTRLTTQVGAPKHGSTEQVSQDGSSRQARSSSAQVSPTLSLGCPLAQ